MRGPGSPLLELSGQPLSSTEVGVYQDRNKQVEALEHVFARQADRRFPATGSSKPVGRPLSSLATGPQRFEGHMPQNSITVRPPCQGGPRRLCRPAHLGDCYCGGRTVGRWMARRVSRCRLRRVPRRNPLDHPLSSRTPAEADPSVPRPSPRLWPRRVLVSHSHDPSWRNTRSSFTGSTASVRKSAARSRKCGTSSQPRRTRMTSPPMATRRSRRWPLISSKADETEAEPSPWLRDLGDLRTLSLTPADLDACQRRSL